MTVITKFHIVSKVAIRRKEESEIRFEKNIIIIWLTKSSNKRVTSDKLLIGVLIKLITCVVYKPFKVMFVILYITS